MMNFDLQKEEMKAEEMETEDRKITEFINNHREFLVNNHIDVAKSLLKNEWFVYSYCEQYGYYEFFTRFTTVAELVDIILDEMRFELYIAIEKEIAPPDSIDNELADMVNDYYQCGNAITEFSILLDIIVNSDLGKNSKFFEKLNKLWKTREDMKKQK